MNVLEEMLRKEVVITLILLIIFLPVIFADENSSQIITKLNVPLSPPVLIKIIPNFSWAVNDNLTNAFNLNDYFMDYNGLTLNYSYSDVTNITIIIDLNNSVSFFSDRDFIGNKEVIFYADDGLFNISSNIVYLFVGGDNEPPQWSSPSKNKATVYQNDYVNFSTIWTDNFALKKYLFSINEGYSWVNSSWMDFSGLYNISRYGVQISAPGGAYVYWMFCARDTSNNINCTDVQVFNVSSRPLPPPPPLPPQVPGFGKGAGILTGFITEYFVKNKIQNFIIEPDYFKISLKQGSTETRILKITNTGNSDLFFNLSSEDIKDFISFSESSFNISAGDSKKITVDFTAKKDTPVEQYFGKIIVKSSLDSREVPVVIDVNPFEIIFKVDVIIPEKYKIVKPGEIVKANITIKNIKDISPGDLKVYYAIKDFYGNIYDSNEESFLFNSYLNIERSLKVPQDAREGEYIFYARAYNNKTSSMNSDSFQVGVRFIFAAVLNSSIIFLLIAVLSIFALILMLRYRREREKERILSLYLMLNELRDLIKEGNSDKAVELYIRIKRAYGEPVSKSAFENKEKLREEIKKLSEKLKSEIKEIKEEVKSENKIETKEETNKEAIKEEYKNISNKEAKKEVEKKETPIEGIKKEEEKEIVKTDDDKIVEIDKTKSVKEEKNKKTDKDVKSKEKEVKKN